LARQFCRAICSITILIMLDGRTIIIAPMRSRVHAAVTTRAVQVRLPLRRYECGTMESK
jgi:hypothetical protein